jgi:tRNA U34 5-carboxymethylaminomethyl modifying GTPase MnmE/TrmE
MRPQWPPLGSTRDILKCGGLSVIMADTGLRQSYDLLKSTGIERVYSAIMDHPLLFLNKPHSIQDTDIPL